MKIVFFGPPGAGKGTQARRLSELLRIPQIATGDIFRAAIARADEFGRKIKGFVESGALVPDDLVIQAVEMRLNGADCRNGYVLDGFPRTIAQADALAGVLTRAGSNLDAVISLEIADKEIVRRLSRRRICPACDQVYHLDTMPPRKTGVCDKCGAKLVIRHDDRPEVIAERLRVYHAQTDPLRDYYQARGLLRPVDASQGPDEVFRSVVRALGIETSDRT